MFAFVLEMFGFCRRTHGWRRQTIGYPTERFFRFSVPNRAFLPVFCTQPSVSSGVLYPTERFFRFPVPNRAFLPISCIYMPAIDRPLSDCRCCLLLGRVATCCWSPGPPLRSSTSCGYRVFAVAGMWQIGPVSLNPDFLLKNPEKS